MSAQFPNGGEEQDCTQFAVLILCHDSTGCASSQAKGTNSTSFLTHAVRNEVELVPLACEDAGCDEMGDYFAI